VCNIQEPHVSKKRVFGNSPHFRPRKPGSEIDSPHQLSRVKMTPTDDTAHLNYLEWQEAYNTEQPYQIFIQLPKEYEHLPTTNLVFHEGPEEVIHDVRGSEDCYTLDEHGFAFRAHTTEVQDWLDEATIKSQYFAELENLIKREVEGADKVVLFDYQVGCSPPKSIVTNSC
jgi:hypothetical protein